MFKRCDGKRDCEDRGDEQVDKWNNFITQVFLLLYMIREMEMIALSWSSQKVTVKMKSLVLKMATFSLSMSQWALSASWRSTRLVKPWKWFLRWGGLGLMPGSQCYTYKRTLISMFSGRETMTRYGIPNFFLKTLIQVRTMQKDISYTCFYEIWTSLQLYETLVLQMLQTSSKDQNTRFYELNNTLITGGASTTWSGILLIVKPATFGWSYRSTIETLWDWIQKVLNSKATRTSWQNTVDQILFCSESNGTQLVFEVVLARPLMSSILTIYIPTLLLLVIRYIAM